MGNSNLQKSNTQSILLIIEEHRLNKSDLLNEDHSTKDCNHILCDTCNKIPMIGRSLLDTNMYCKIRYVNSQKYTNEKFCLALEAIGILNPYNQFTVNRKKKNKYINLGIANIKKYLDYSVSGSQINKLKAAKYCYCYAQKGFVVPINTPKILCAIKKILEKNIETKIQKLGQKQKELFIDKLFGIYNKGMSTNNYVELLVYELFLAINAEDLDGRPRATTLKETLNCCRNNLTIKKWL